MYDMDDLVPIVAMLTEKYTGHDSSSVTYEKANSADGGSSVLHPEVQNGGEGILVSQQQSAMQAYRTGYSGAQKDGGTACLLRTQEKAGFVRMGMYICGYIAEGDSGFFEHMTKYLSAQNTILTLDYPILVDVSQYQGIDCVICMSEISHRKQLFLAKFCETM